MLYFACRMHFVYLCILKISHKYHALWEMPRSFVTCVPCISTTSNFNIVESTFLIAVTDLIKSSKEKAGNSLYNYAFLRV